MPRAPHLNHRRGTLIASAVSLCLLIAACASAPPAEKPPSATGGTLADTAVPGSILLLPLTTSSGRTITLSSFHGEFLVLCDVTTLGQGTSPVNTAAVVAAARAVQRAGLGNRVRFVSITIDPERDTPARLGAYRSLYPDPPADWTLLTGSPDSIDVLWDYFGIQRGQAPTTPARAFDWMTSRPLSYTIVHNDRLDFLDHTFHDRFVLRGAADIPGGDILPAPLETWLKDQGRDDLTPPPSPEDWTIRQVLNVVGWLTARSIPSTSDG